VLRSAARRIKDAVRPHDQVVRLGGDEFLVILEQITHKMDAAHVAERVVHAFQENFKTSQGVHSVGTSIGISVFPDDGADPDTLLQNGDIAMYSVKTSGKGNYRFYDQKFYDALRARLQQESALRHAIEHDEFIMYYPLADRFSIRDRTDVRGLGNRCCQCRFCRLAKQKPMWQTFFTLAREFEFQSPPVPLSNWYLSFDDRIRFASFDLRTIKWIEFSIPLTAYPPTDDVYMYL
jgi:hypothetical protein